MPAYQRAFEDFADEHDWRDMDVDGEIPRALRGTIYSTGPSLSGLFGEAYTHWFDGDGAVSAVRFDGSAQSSAKLIQTPGLVHERELGRMIYGGYARPSSLSMLLKPPMRRGKNTGNTSVLATGGKLFALWEGGRPIEIDPESLATLGPSNFDGKIAAAYSAHPHRVAARNAIYNFGLRADPRPFLDVFETRGGSTRRITSLSMWPMRMVHDFIATEKHLVFFIPPVRLRLFRALVGWGGFSDNLRWDPSLGTEIVVVPIDEPDAVVRYRTEAFYQWHFVNAFEHGSDIVIDLIRYPDFRTNEWLISFYRGRPLPESHGTLDRAVLTPKSKRFAVETRWNHPCEFPTIAPSRKGATHGYAYVAAHRDISAVREGGMTRVAKFEIESGHATMVDMGDSIVGEPYFVPAGGGEDDGWVLCHVYDVATHRTYLAIFDASSMELKAKCWFGGHLPPRLHGDWVAS